MSTFLGFDESLSTQQWLWENSHPLLITPRPPVTIATAAFDLGVGFEEEGGSTSITVNPDGTGSSRGSSSRGGGGTSGAGRRGGLTKKLEPQTNRHLWLKKEPPSHGRSDPTTLESTGPSEAGSSGSSSADSSHIIPESPLGVRMQRVGVSILFILEVLLRGVSQCMALNHPVSGGFMLFGMAVTDFHFPGLALLGAFFANLGAIAFGRRTWGEADVRLGLYGYDGVLVSVACKVFVYNTTGSSTGTNLVMLYIAALIGSFFAGILRCSFGSVLRRLDIHILPLTFTFCVTAIGMIHLQSVLLSSSSSSSNTLSSSVVTASSSTTGSSSAGNTTTCSPTTEAPVVTVAPMTSTDAAFWAVAVSRGIGQIIFADHPLGGLVVLVGIAICSRRAAIAAGVGSIVGTGLALALLPQTAAQLTAIGDGLLSYNSTLTAIVLGSGVFLSSGKTNPATIGAENRARERSTRKILRRSTSLSAKNKIKNTTSEWREEVESGNGTAHSSSEADEDEKMTFRNGILLPILGAAVAFPLHIIWGSVLADTPAPGDDSFTTPPVMMLPFVTTMWILQPVIKMKSGSAEKLETPGSQGGGYCGCGCGDQQNSRNLTDNELRARSRQSIRNTTTAASEKRFLKLLDAQERELEERERLQSCVENITEHSSRRNNFGTNENEDDAIASCGFDQSGIALSSVNTDECLPPPSVIHTVNGEVETMALEDVDGSGTPRSQRSTNGGSVMASYSSATGGGDDSPHHHHHRRDRSGGAKSNVNATPPPPSSVNRLTNTALEMNASGIAPPANPFLVSHASSTTPEGRRSRH